MACKQSLAGKNCDLRIDGYPEHLCRAWYLYQQPGKWWGSFEAFVYGKMLEPGTYRIHLSLSPDIGYSGQIEIYGTEMEVNVQESIEARYFFEGQGELVEETLLQHLEAVKAA